MKPSARSAIRNDILADYERPSPDLAVRVLRAIPTSLPSSVSHRGRVALQTAAVVMVALSGVFGARPRPAADVEAAAHIIERGLLGR